MKFVDVIDEVFHNQSKEKRNYLGASSVGHNCKRHVQFYWLYILGRVSRPDFDPRIKRIFDRGNLFEDKLREWMKKARFVFEEDDSKLQFQDFEGKFRGHVDGVLLDGPLSLDYPVLWECKCLNAKNSDKLEARGLRKTKPKYFAQVQLYMHYLGLSHCLFTSINADTMSIYEEVVRFDRQYTEQLLVTVSEIFIKTDQNKFMLRTSSDFDCTYCEFRIPCFTGKEQDNGI